jgi:hypothetical protein
MSLSRIFLIIAVRRCGRSTSDVKTFAFFACSATPVNTCWVVRSRVGPGWEFLAALSRVSPFERMFVACLLLRDGAAHADDIESKSLSHFQKLGSVPEG